MFSHVMVGANDLPRMVRFYDAVLEYAGLARTVEPQDAGPAGVIWRRPGLRWPQFAIRKPVDGRAATSGNGVQVSFVCASKGAVDEAWAAALRHGGDDVGPPGDRPVYSDDFYAAYVKDPEGNKLCFLFCREFASR
ncbi:VOC family protein [Stappia indica]|uniref:VOC family protein n=1 Tax=Stappia indica TaxID=538381 RepID=UPI00082C8C94|nr:VOC family protein [Stappia indica]